MDKQISYKFGSEMSEMIIEVKVSCDHKNTLLPQVDNLLLKTIEIIEDLQFKTNEDGLRMSEDTESTTEDYCTCGETNTNTDTCITCGKKIKNTENK